MVASHFRAELVCAWVAVVLYEPVQLTDRSIMAQPYAPHLAEPAEEGFDPQLEARLASVLDATGVAWSTRTLTGDPAEALGGSRTCWMRR